MELSVGQLLAITKAITELTDSQEAQACSKNATWRDEVRGRSHDPLRERYTDSDYHKGLLTS